MTHEELIKKRLQFPKINPTQNILLKCFIEDLKELKLQEVAKAIEAYKKGYTDGQIKVVNPLPL